MMGSLRHWWSAHSETERRFMALLGCAILVVVLWLGVWRPIDRGLAAGWERQRAALDRNASVRAKVEALRRLPATARGASAPIDQLVGQSAAEAGFTLGRATGQGEGRMAVTIGSARMPALMGWLAGLEGKGVLVETISIAPGATEGTVAVQALLREASQ